MAYWHPDAVLGLDEYLADFYRHFATLARDFRKLEAGQTFSEPGDASWEAFAAGNWTRAVELMGEVSEQSRRYFDELKARGRVARRVRLVREPLSDYLIWELNGLRRNERLGERIRVLPVADALRAVPSAYVDDFALLDTTVAYRVLYDASGCAAGAERSTDAADVAGIAAAFDTLFDAGEDLDSYHRRRLVGHVPTSAVA